MTRVLVVGPGALGGLLAALLHEAGHETRLVGRRGAVARVRIEGGAYGRDRDVALATDAGAPDLVVLATKTQDLEAALAQHAAAFGEAPVVALQNGLAQDKMVARVVGEKRAVAAIAALDAQMLEPDVVECARKGTLVLGPAHPDAADAAREATRTLSSAVDVQTTTNARGARWTKLLVNLSNVVPALTGLSYQQAARHAGLAEANVRMLREGMAVARAEGVELAPLPWTSPTLLRAAGLLPMPVARRVYAARVHRVLGEAPGYGSTWQSLQRGRSVETDWLNGAVVERGAARGVPTPVNGAACRLAREGRVFEDGDAAAAALLARPIKAN